MKIQRDCLAKIDHRNEFVETYKNAQVQTINKDNFEKFLDHGI